jgi:hypothetical protein
VSRRLHDLYAFLQEHRRCGELASRRQWWARVDDMCAWSVTLSDFQKIGW